ncbi:hypothetical protein DNTS_007809 [Danionella cerebrum]|uniref:Uncharacterized protein n=1 Tax=Danionella cerebrum TaxID=2873325 RepID=A0A553N5N2_9TELE|nr:hypothetical protein DNTS_007809 [Danionella translucida]
MANASHPRYDKNKETVSPLRASRDQQTSAAPHRTEQETNRLREVMEGSSRTAELRWKINRLEREMLDLTSKHNQEVSRYEAQVARMRAQLECGEAQRQSLELESAVLKRDTAAEMRNAEEKINQMRTHHQRVDALNSELRQKVSDLQSSLEISQKAREEDLQGLQAELRERDHLLLSASTEVEWLQDEMRRLEMVTQEKQEALRRLRSEMERLRRDGEKESEKLRRRLVELKRSSDREEKLRSDLEASLQRLKDLDQSLEAEQAAHAQTKLTSDIIQVRIQDLEASLEQERRSHAELCSALELWKQKCEGLEEQLAREKENTLRMSHSHKQMEAEHLTEKISQLEEEKVAKADLIAQLEQEKAASADLIGRLAEEKATTADLIGQLEQEKAGSAQLSLKLQEQEKEWADRQQNYSQAQEALVGAQHSLLSEVQHVLQRFQQQGATQAHLRVQTGTLDSSAVLDVLQQTLHHYSMQLQESEMVIQKLNLEVKERDETISVLQMNVQECESQGASVSEEVKRLRVCVSDAAVDLRRLAEQLQEEKTQSAIAHTQLHTWRQQQHSLSQRLIAGCVLVTPPQSMLGSFSWEELSSLVQEHVETLTSDLSLANQKVEHLESVCEGKSEELECVRAQMRDQKEIWIREKEDLNAQHSHSSRHLQKRIQGDLRKHSELEQEVTRLHALITSCSREEARLLAASALLAGAVRGLSHQRGMLKSQNALLREQVHEAEIMRSEVTRLVQALGEPEVRAQRSLRFRRCVRVVMAAGRLKALGRRTKGFFRVQVDLGADHIKTLICVNPGGEQTEDRLRKMLSSSELLELIHSSMEDVQREMTRSGQKKGPITSGHVKDSGLIPAAQRGCEILLQQLLQDEEPQDLVHHGKNVLQLTAEKDTAHRHSNSKVLMASLQKHILEFTRRLHSAELERRSLRMELTRHTHSDYPSAARDTHAQFQSVCEQLSRALEREQCAQALLRDQAHQLQELGLSMELHTGDQLEREKTLSQAVQSLSEAKLELRRRNQSLHMLGKQLSQSEHDKRQLQEDREGLRSYMKSLREQGMFSSSASTLHDALLLSRASLILPQSIIENPELETCQKVLVSSSFEDLFSHSYSFLQSRFLSSSGSSGVSCDWLIRCWRFEGNQITSSCLIIIPLVFPAPERPINSSLTLCLSLCSAARVCPPGWSWNSSWSVSVLYSVCLHDTLPLCFSLLLLSVLLFVSTPPPSSVALQSSIALRDPEVLGEALFTLITWIQSESWL